MFKKLFIANLSLVLFVINFCVICNKSNAETTDFSTSGTQKQFDCLLNYKSDNYELGPNDILSLNVYDSPEFNQEEVRVNPDGKIFLAPVGEINVDGLTISQLKLKLTMELKKYLNDPRITLKLVQTKTFRVYVNGAVMNPGAYEFDTDIIKQGIIANNEIKTDRITPILTNALMIAGGISYDADLEHIKVANPSKGRNIEVNLLNLLDKNEIHQDVYLERGDVVYVPKLKSAFALEPEKYIKYAHASFSPKTIPVKILGYVNSPGLIELKTSQSLNINSAIAASGGYKGDSPYPPKKVFLSRNDANGKLATVPVNPSQNDIVLMPNDIIYVPDKIRPITGRAFDFIARLASPANVYANTYNNWAYMFNPDRYHW